MVYKHCTLTKDNKTTISWIPEKFAVKGKILDLKFDGEWKRGWTVEKVGIAKDKDEIIAQSSEYRSHRKRTDK